MVLVATVAEFFNEALVWEYIQLFLCNIHVYLPDFSVGHSRILHSTFVAEGLLLATQFVNTVEVILVFYALLKVWCVYLHQMSLWFVDFTVHTYEPAPVDCLESLIQSLKEYDVCSNV
jgi:hypothetical protein